MGLSLESARKVHRPYGLYEPDKLCELSPSKALLSSKHSVSFWDSY